MRLAAPELLNFSWNWCVPRRLAGLARAEDPCQSLCSAPEHRGGRRALDPVSDPGSDSGTSPTSAWATLTLLSKVKAGDTVTFRNSLHRSLFSNPWRPPMLPA